METSLMEADPEDRACEHGDSAGITGTPPMLELAALAPHPRNPREDLGDLTELAASISAHGVFEPLVLLTRAAYEAAADADGDTERPEGGEWTHVIVMGHRRAAASADAGLAEVPYVIRDDLAGAEAIAAMISENRNREGLTPLAEAAGMAELTRRGWSQRKIAERNGCSQAHVSKRLTLLELPAAARDAIAGGTLPVAQALELHAAVAGADADIAEAAIAKALADIGSGYHAQSAVAGARRDAARAQQARITLADLQARGIQVIDTGKRDKMGWPFVSERDAAGHETAGCLAAAIDHNGHPDYACTNPAGHAAPAPADRGRARELEDERETRRAAQARDTACTVIAAGPLPAAGDLSRILAAAVLGNSGYAESMRLACKWLRDAGLAPAGADHYALRDQLAAAGDEAGLARYARAFALAADELHVRSRWNGYAWGGRHEEHLGRLAAAAGYEPTGWELARLDEAREVDKARGSLCCPDCGCSSRAVGSAGCDVTFDRDAGRPVYRCLSWDCKTHQAWREARDNADGGAGDDGPPVVVLLYDLVAAADPSTAAGSRLPDGFSDAICTPLDQLADAAGQAELTGDMTAATAAARQFAAVAAAAADAWTPELRAALQALAAASVIDFPPGTGDPDPGPQ
jgi:ParB/RepB/Spo0J family partition protein